ncbi:hypothetical protein JYU19_02545, partial [bacterium AH-315-J21]|nr:hypothetical protein [bacterium AH-315-J21]
MKINIDSMRGWVAEKLVNISGHKNYDQMEKHYLKSIEKNPDSATDHAQYARFLKRYREDIDKAEKHYLRAIELEPDNADWLTQYSMLLFYQRSDHIGALQYIERAIADDSTNVQALQVYAHIHIFATKRYELAMSSLESTLLVEPDNPVTLSFLGQGANRDTEISGLKE